MPAVPAVPAEPAVPATTSTYRMAPALVVRLAGGVLVAAAVLVMLLGLVAALAGWPGAVVVVAAVVAVVLVAGWAAWLRYGAAVLRLDDAGYRVRFLRDVGPRAGSWAEVREVVADSPGGVPCLVLRRRDGAGTVVPVAVLAAAGDAVADDVVARLRAASRPDAPHRPATDLG